MHLMRARWPFGFRGLAPALDAYFRVILALAFAV
jgi:hypothetical protein